MDIELIQNFITEYEKSINGWFFKPDQIAFHELISMQNHLAVSGDLCEVGVYQGKSLVFLSLLKSLENQLIGFDLFDGDDLKITKFNLEKYGLNEGVTLHKGLTSDLAIHELDDKVKGPLRFLHIDAGHEYHEVLEQLALFSPYVSDQGIIAMDDYQDREFPGIEAAVLDFAERDRPRRFVPFLAGGNKMYLCAVPMASLLQSLLLKRENFKDKCRLTRVRDFNILIMGSKLPVLSENIGMQLSLVNFPRRAESALTLNEKSMKYSQIRFGAGKD